jgi:hypothetical protein
MRNPRRSYNGDNSETAPMTLGKMRESGIRSIDVECMVCDREATVNVDRPVEAANPCGRCALDLPRAIGNLS